MTAAQFGVSSFLPNIKILGEPFRVYATDIDDLKNQVKVENQNRLRTVDAPNLKFNDSAQVSELWSLAKIDDLGLANNEILLIQLPQVSRKRKMSNEEQMYGGLLDQYHRAFWGHPLPQSLTKLEANSMAMPADNEESNDEDLESNVLSDEPFLDVGERFLVRAEYILVFDAVKGVYEKDHARRLAVVTGYPGIGKTIWISYALRRCLGEKQPVIWYRVGQCFLFSEVGVSIIKPMNYETQGKHTWCFVDAKDADTLPPNICDKDWQLFPVYVTSPQEKRWHRLPQTGRIPAVVMMNPWNWQEIKKASQLYPDCDLADIQRRFDNAGPSPRLCFDYPSEDLDKFYRDRNSSIQWIATAQQYSALVERSRPIGMGDISDSIYKVQRADSNMVNGEYVVEPASGIVRQMLLTQLWTIDENEYAKLHSSSVPATHGAEGLLFESKLQRVFAKRIDIVAEPMFRTKHPRSQWHAAFGDLFGNPMLQAARASQNTPSSLTLMVEPHHPFPYSSEDAADTIERDVYYVPMAGNEVLIDAVILHGEYLYLLQFSASPVHTIKSEVENIGRRFSGLPPQKNWRFIFVVPEDLASFACSHHDSDFLKHHNPYTARVAY